MNTLPHLLTSDPDAIALIDRDHAITRRELDLESRRVARGLLDLSIGEGDRVALWLPNVPAWLACLFACARIGAVVVAVNTRFRVSELQDILGRSGATALVFWPGFRGIDFEAIIDSHPSIGSSQVVGVDGARGPYAAAFVIARDGAVVDEQAIIAHCARRIAAYKVPKRVMVVDAFPVTHSANGTKIQKARLREMAREILKD